MLDLFEQNQDIAARPSPQEGRDLPATFGESFAASWASGELASSSIKQANARNQAISEFADLVQRAGGDVNSEYASRIVPGFGEQPMEPDGLDVVNSALAKLKAKNPSIALQPMTEDGLSKRAVELSQEAIAGQAAQQGKEQTFGSRAGSLFGGLASGVNDPINIPMMMVAPEGELGALGTAGLFGALSAGTQAVSEAANAGYNEKVSPGYGERGDALANIVETAAGGAVLGWAIKGVGNVLTRLATGAWPTAARDAANVIKSEANIETSNVLPGIEGEAEHRVALAKSIDQILNGEPVEPSIAAASRDVMERAQREQAFRPPNFDEAEIGRISDEAALTERSKALESELAGIPAGDRQAAETLARVSQVEQEMREASTAADRRALSRRRDELLADTTPEKLQAAAAPIEQRRVAEAEQAWIAGRLEDIRSARAQAELDHAIAGAPPQMPLLSRLPLASPPTLFDIHEGRIDALMGMREGARAVAETSPELPYRVKGIARGVTALAQLGGHDMPAAEAEGLADRIMASRTPDEARFILGQITDRPRTLAATLPSAADFAAAAKDAERVSPQPSSLMTTQQMQEAVASPEAQNAMRADIERAIDNGAKEGKAPQVPIGVDANGEPIMGSVARALNEVDAYKTLADQIAQCALPGAMQAEE